MMKQVGLSTDDLSTVILLRGLDSGDERQNFFVGQFLEAGTRIGAKHSRQLGHAVWYIRFAGHRAR